MPTTDPRSGPGRVRLVGALVVLLVVGVAAGLLWRTGAGPLPDPPGCTAKVAGTPVSLTTTQSENAALIAAVSVGRGLPARAASIALAAAFQESKLRNLAGGDRDSVGLFQQRPSQGWGTREQLMDPLYATNAFYDALEKVDGYQDMRITEAAQAVQRSGYPEAYEEHAAGARALASALTGYSPSRFTCVVRPGPVAAESPGPEGLTPRAATVKEDLEAVFGQLPMGGFDPDGVTSGHIAGSAHYDGRAIDVFVRPISSVNRRHGWAIAAYLVAQADRLGIEHVIFDGQIWTAGKRSESGWQDFRPVIPEGASPATVDVLEHREHVHVDVLDGEAP